MPSDTDAGLQAQIDAIANAVADRLTSGRVPVVPRYLTPEQASVYTGIAHNTLANWRTQASRLAGPPFMRKGIVIRYDRVKLDAWMEAQTVQPGSARQ